MCWYASIGDEGSIKNLIELGVKIDATDYDQRTALHLAAAEGNPSIVDLLLFHNAQMIYDANGETPFHDAVRGEHTRILSTLHRTYPNGPPPNFEILYNSLKQSQIFIDIADLNVDKIKLYLRANLPINIQDYDGRTPLHVACSFGHQELIKLLVRHGANTEVLDKFGYKPRMVSEQNQLRRQSARTYSMRNVLNSPLGSSPRSSFSGSHSSTYKRRMTALDSFSDTYHSTTTFARSSLKTAFESESVLSNAIQAARNLPISVTCTPKQTQKILMTVLQCRHIADNNFPRVKQMQMALEHLLGPNAQRHLYDYDFRTPLHIAAGHGRMDMALYLLVRGANVNAKDRWGRTPLYEATIRKQKQLMKVIIQQSGTYCLKGYPLASLLIYLVIEGDLEILHLAVLSGIELNSHDYDMRTALHIAGDLGYAAIYEYLVGKGASVKARDRFGNTPMLRRKPRNSLNNNAFC
ncbi:hypothetical protein FGO68_gene15843 [Halteria grandinella]|uniref:Ankyrin n=1 Tax=Halteria grandinella TaxID=5974 RepID=A0A8J8NFC0_HALGN|nr:hypothetical protein FGO68_gene15843 [Halteria grandinella]